MSQSPITITLTLEEMFARFEKRFDKLEAQIETLQKDVTHIKLDQAKRFSDLQIEQVKLSEKMDGLSKRVDNQELTNRGILIALIVAILGGVAKLLGLVGNP